MNLPSLIQYHQGYHLLYVTNNSTTHLFSSLGFPVEDGLGSFVVLPIHGSSKRCYPRLVSEGKVQGWVGQQEGDDAGVGVLYGMVKGCLALCILV